MDDTLFCPLISVCFSRRGCCCAVADYTIVLFGLMNTENRKHALHEAKR